MERGVIEKLERAARAMAYALAFALPLFALPDAFGSMEFQKQTFAILTVGAAALCGLVAWGLEPGNARVRGWVPLFGPTLVVVATVASAAVSSAPFRSFVGSAGQEYVAALTAFVGVVAFALVLHVLSSDARRRAFGLAWSAGMAAAGAIGVGAALRGSAFSTVGSMGVLVLLLSAAVAYGMARLAYADDLSGDARVRRAERALLFVLLLEALFLLCAIHDRALWLAFGAGQGYLLAGAFLRSKGREIRRFLPSMFLLAVSALFLFGVPSPVSTRMPLEVTPSVSGSYAIVRASLAEAGLWLGSGPGTFAFDYAKFHDPSVNATELWAHRFDRSASFLWTVAAGSGLAGIIAWVAFLLIASGSNLIAWAKRRDFGKGVVSFAFGSAFAVLAAGAFVLSFNVTAVILSFLIAGAAAATGPGHAATTHRPWHRTAVRAAAIVMSVILLTVLFVAVQRSVSERALMRAARASERGAPAIEVVSALERAVANNRWNDSALRYASARIVKLMDEELARVQTEGDTEERRAYVRALSVSAASAADRATELSPRDTLNWLARAEVMRALIPYVEDADLRAEEANLRAISLDHAHPAARLELGITCLAAASANPDAAADWLARAEEAFLHATELKPDYARAHYYLSIVYDRQGRLDDAIAKMRRVKEFNPLDVGVAFQLGVLHMRRNADDDSRHARLELERALALAPAYADARWFLATVFERTGDLPAAIAQIEYLVAEDPANPILLQRLARLQSGTSDPSIPDSLGD